MKYDEIYKNNANVWGDKPNLLLLDIFSELEPKSDFLDLGCGQGRDSLFMLQNGFKVTAVDKSPEAINSIKQVVKENDLPIDNIKLYCDDVQNFVIEKNKFSAINVFNLFHFLPKEIALAIIERIKAGLIIGGYVIVSGFTDSDPLSKNDVSLGGCYFGGNELKNLFSDFKITAYLEAEVDDPGHPGYVEPHKHHLVKMLAKKI